MCWSPDSHWLAVCNGDDKIQRWNADENRPTGDWRLKDVLSLAWSPDGKWLAAVAKGGDICLLDSDGGAQAIMKCDPDWARLFWSPDSHWLAVTGYSRAIQTWDVQRRIAGPQLCVPRRGECVWEPDSRRLVSYDGSRTLRRWDVANGEFLSVSAMMPDGKGAYISQGGKLEVNDPKAEDELIYYVQQASGALKLYTPAEFRRLVEAGKTSGKVAASLGSKPLADDDRWTPWQDLFDGKSLDGWQSATKDQGGKVTVGTGSIVLDAPHGYSRIVTTKPMPKINYELSIVAKRIGGLNFCSTDFSVNDTGCTFIVGGYGDDTVGLGMVDGLPAKENETTRHVRFENDRWYTIRLQVTDDRIRGWIDNEAIVDLRTSSRKLLPCEPKRIPLGIYAWQGKAVIRSIRLRQLKPEAGK